MKSQTLHNQGESLGLIGQSDTFLQLLESISQVAPTNITVLITGESGTGKERIAKAIHQLSQRKEKPLITVNCGAIPEGILESELFGHEKGSFTGAVEMRKGYFETADTGTLFLDEIGEMPLATQVKLLRVLEEKEFLRVGGNKMIHVDVRVLAATNKNLKLAVDRNEFRKDLFYRLNAVHVEVPPLRMRKKDIRLLAIHFAEQISTENNIKFQGFSEDALQFMENHPWQGNIRELRNIVERIIVLEGGKPIKRSHLESHLISQEPLERPLPIITHKSPDQAERELIYRALIELRMSVEEIKSYLKDPLNQKPPLARFTSPVPTEIMGEDKPNNIPTMKEMEKQQIERALEMTQGNRRKAAKLLQIGERTLYRKLKEYKLDKYL